MPAVIITGQSLYEGFENESGEYNPSHSMSGNPNVGSPDVFINGGAVVCVGDVSTNGSDGDSYEATSGSSSVFINGKAVVRVGDPGRNWDDDGGSGTGSFVSSSSNVFIGG